MRWIKWGQIQINKVHLLFATQQASLVYFPLTISLLWLQPLQQIFHSPDTKPLLTALRISSTIFLST
jgi:hypothetical protein